MFSAAELIDAVQRKLRLTQRRSHPPGEFPPGWAAWFAQMRERADANAVTGATAESMVTVLLARPQQHVPTKPLAELTRWQAFASVWRQQWHPPAADERGLRWLAGILSAIIHVLLGLLLLWLLFADPRFDHAPPEGEEVVQVEFIGTGTPDEEGGGPEPAVEAAEAAAEVEPTRQAAAVPPMPAESSDVPEVEPPMARASASIEAPDLTVTPPPVANRDIPEPEPAEAAVEQRLTVSEPAPDDTEAFFLPPPTPRIAEAVVAPELEAVQADVATREVPTPVSAPERPELDIPVDSATTSPEVNAEVPEIARRDVPAPISRPALQARPVPSSPTPELQAQAPQVREARIPAPSPAPATSAAEAVTDATVAEQASGEAAAPQASAEPGPSAASTASTTSADRSDSGPRSEPAPGGWPTPARSDDWGDSTRNVPGGQRGEDDGLYNSDGSVRLADTPGSASPGQPPGAHTEEITDLDRTGTWLKRPPIGYEPTMFDRYWRPNETLLQEWVRRGVKEVAIPIPGSSKTINCAVSLLALGGACGISDPNLNEQPAEARPPPDIPFKPELQEDNGSVRPEGD